MARRKLRQSDIRHTQTMTSGATQTCLPTDVSFGAPRNVNIDPTVFAERRRGAPRKAGKFCHFVFLTRVTHPLTALLAAL